MKFCLSCTRVISPESWQCQSCGWSPKIINDVPHLAPDMIGTMESYNPDWYNELASIENQNFWFISRNQLIRWLVLQYFPENGKYLEVGCGTGYVLQLFYKILPKWKISASEVEPEGIKYAKKRVSHQVDFLQMDACSIPFEDEFDAIGAFDVLEHIPDDVKSLDQIYRALKFGGLFILSVPQHKFLWSRYDEVGCHFRRYSVDELKSKLESAGFSIILSTSFNTLLLPLLLLSRYFNKKKSIENFDVLDELRLPKAVNLGLLVIMKFEFFLLKIGIRLPFGSSRMVVARK